MTKPNRKSRGTHPPRRVSVTPIAPQQEQELYHVIVQCHDEAQQRELYERLRREGFRCRLTVL